MSRRHTRAMAFAIELCVVLGSLAFVHALIGCASTPRGVVIPVGPAATLVLWLVILVVIARHNASAIERHATQLPLYELIPVAVGLAMIQLLLDLHRAWLGDLVVAGVHLIGFATVWLRRRARG